MEDYKKYVTDSLVKKTVILPEYDMWGHVSYKVSLPYYDRLIPLHKAVGGFAPDGFIGSSIIVPWIEHITYIYAVPDDINIQNDIWLSYVGKMHHLLDSYTKLLGFSNVS